MVNGKLKGQVPFLANLFNKVYKGKDKMLSKVDQMATRITYFFQHCIRYGQTFYHLFTDEVVPCLTKFWQNIRIRISQAAGPQS